MAIFSARNIQGATTTEGGYREILKTSSTSALENMYSVVLDASTVAADGAGRRRLLAGTLLSKNGTTNQYERFTAAGGQAIKGVLALDVEFLDGSAGSDTPAPMIHRDATFRADRIVDFGTHGAAARTALPTCKFE